jgi:preprotein translocase subunit SecA
VYRKFNEKKKKCYQELWISFDLRISESNCYQTGFLKNTRAMQNLIVIDYFWTDHLERMSNLRETINWRSYGQENPLTEYNLESFQSLKLMFDQIRSSMLYYFLNKSMIEL